MKGKKMKKLLSYIALLAMVVVNIVGNGMVSKASEVTKTFKLKGTLDTVEIKAGETQHVKIPFNLNSNTYFNSVENISFSVDVDTNAPINITSDVTVKFASTSAEVTTLTKNTEYVLEFDIETTELASNGTYKLSIVGTGDYIDYDTGEYSTCALNFSKKLSVKVTGQKAASKIKISSINYDEEVNRGDEFDISLKVGNTGDLTAKDVSISLGDRKSVV